MLVGLSLLWGGSFFIDLVVDDLPPLTIVLVRVGLAAPALWLLVMASHRQLPRGGAIWLAFFTMGMINNVIPFTLIVWGQSQIASGLAAILNATTPLFTVFVAGVLLADERFSLRKLVGLGFGGVVIMLGPDLLQVPGGELLAEIAILGAINGRLSWRPGSLAHR